MKTLILMRHAKSDWAQGTPDRERPLNGRGRRAAALMGVWLAEEGLIPDAARVSSAVRTRETWDRLAAQWQHPPEARFEDGLYLCEPDAILAAVQAAQGERLLVLGHNPGMGRAMERIADELKHLDCVTAAVAVYRLPVASWRNADFGIGRLVQFQVPKSLV